MEFIKLKTLGFALIALMNITSFSQTQSEIQNAFSKSYTLESDKEYEQAIGALNVVYNEDSYEINLRLGWLYYLSNKQVKSIDYYKKCIHIMPVASEPLWGILNPYVTIEDWVNVENIYLKILKLDAKNTTANYKLGLIYYTRKNYTKAKIYFDVLLNLSPFNYDAMLMSGWTQYFLGNLNNAKVLFQKVLLYSPNDSSALDGLGLIK